MSVPAVQATVQTAAVVPLVDSHAHIFTRAMPLVAKPRHRPTYDFTLQHYLAELDLHGVEYGVIAAASPWGDYNDYTIECVAATPRLRGTVILHPDKPYDLAAMKRAGIAGVRLPFIGLPQLPDISSASWRALLRRIADQDWHVHLHVEGRHIAALLPLLEQGGPRIVIDHLGRPAPDEPKGSAGYRAIVAAAQRGRVWIKASCGYRIGKVGDEHFLGFLQELGPERLFWASDCPFVGHEGQLSYADTIAWLAALLPDPEARRLVFGVNARKFYFGSE
jgi:predicted TIM-barrel fold metal-dependent hydrolase